MKDGDVELVRHFLVLGATNLGLLELANMIARWEWQGPGVWVGVEEEKLAGYPGVFEASIRAVERLGDTVDVRYLNTELQRGGMAWQVPQSVSRIVDELNGLKKHVLRGPFVVSHPCSDCCGEGDVDARDCRTCRGTGVGRFFHGTKANLEAGSLIEPGHGANYGKLERTTTYVYFTGTLDAATWGAELALGEGRGRIYVVEPTGLLEDDPNLTDKKFPGNPTKSYRSRAPLRVVGEVVDWQGHSPAALKAMKDGLERLRAEGVQPID